MHVVLAGHNIDYELIAEIQALQPARQDLTPETVAAAYARISRNPKPVSELRAIARGEVEKARASNRNIVFEMGHGSIAEHAVFNLDILEVSRLLVEEIERFRLASYTEKSQRYVLLADDFVVPQEVREAGLEESFIATVRRQNRFYFALYEKLLPYVLEQNHGLAADPANRSLLEGWAKEDARYGLSLATETQLGMTANARSIELMIRRLAASPLAEAREYSRRLFDAVKKIAPSLVRYTEPTPYDRDTRDAIRSFAEELLSGQRAGGSGTAGSQQSSPRESRSGEAQTELVRLCDWTPGGDERIAAAILHGESRLPLQECEKIAARMGSGEKRSLIREALRRMQVHDAAPRIFETVGFTFELTTSASCFAQLKRHRMATVTAQDYDPALGVTIPPSVAAVGMEPPFRELCAQSERLWEAIRRKAPAAAGYILTNAHRRRVLIRVSARELYHFVRVRADGHAQWDIRETALRMLELAREAMPVTLLLASGKDGFAALRARIYDDER